MATTETLQQNCAHNVQIAAKIASLQLIVYRANPTPIYTILNVTVLVLMAGTLTLIKFAKNVHLLVLHVLVEKHLNVTAVRVA